MTDAEIERIADPEKITIHIRMIVSECQICGVRSPFHCAVLGAGGHYCKECAPFAAAMAKRQSDMHLARCMATGTFTFSPLWWPERTVVERPTCIPRVRGEVAQLKAALTNIANTHSNSSKDCEIQRQIARAAITPKGDTPSTVVR